MFHPHWRAQALAHLDETFDVTVIGGGITGCGIFMDAAQRGLRALLVERQDIACGTSSRSSKLIHGGLRYLKQMQFRVTRVACRERDRMLVLNPDLVRPIRFLYPVREGDRTPGWTVDLGLWMYDRLTRRSERHTHLTREEVQAMAPGLAVENLDRTMAYTDAVVDDAALTLAVAATGFAYGGFVLTRADVVEATTDADGRINGVVVRDAESGETRQVHSHLVINAAGVWVDQLRATFGLAGARLRPARGSHIIFRADRLALNAAVTIPSPDDGRPVFLIPHPEGILMGTTDIYHEGPLDDPRVTRAEMDYLLRAVQASYPDAHFTAADVVGAFAGIRPILYTHSENPSEASREEDIWEERGMLSVAGGKLTTWRRTAQEAVNTALKYLPDERRHTVAPCYTAGTPLVDLAPPDLAARLRDTHSVPVAVAEGMARRLRSAAWWAPRLARQNQGMLRRLRGAAWWVPRFARSDKELLPLMDGTDLSAAEVRVHLAFGAVLHLEDLLLRRVRVGLWQPALALELVPRLRPLFQQELGWKSRRWDRETQAFEAALQGWSPEGVR
ncbi:MAG: glycerol-3-phosphate dehydrogenase/oxidase [Candidatus Binatia bacterium]